jgi:hypothetical protein
MMIAGIAVTGVGAVVVAASMAVLFKSAPCAPGTADCGEGSAITFFSLIAAGGAHILVGLPLLIVGGLPPKPAPPPPVTPWETAGSPRQIGLRWAF